MAVLADSCTSAARKCCVGSDHVSSRWLHVAAQVVKLEIPLTRTFYHDPSQGIYMPCFIDVNPAVSEPYARFYELGLTRELTNPRVGVIPSLILV